MTSANWFSVILAAGLGTRMKSRLPKVLHPVAGRPMLAHAISAAKQAGTSGSAIVISPEMQEGQARLQQLDPAARFHVQTERLGTAHAVLAARPALFDQPGAHIVVLYGDTPLLRPETLGRLVSVLETGAAVAVLGFESQNPSGYGRILRNDEGEVVAIREDKDASDAERAIRLCNSGVIGFRAGQCLSLIERIGNSNAKQEYYLTDAVEIARADGLPVACVTCDEDEVMGINDRVQLAAAEAVMQNRLRETAMRGGVTMTAPETVFMSWDTQLGQDVTIEPNVFFGPGVTVEDGAEIKANSHIEQAVIRKGASIGPFARLRPGADIGEGAKIGNYVEVKNARVETGAKVNHLAYVGDARVGARANLGAGTIICNYDGFKKSFTEIDDEAFVGSNSSLVAPVKIGRGAYIGSGSVIVRDVEPDALAVERSHQRQIPGWAARNREKNRKG
jgi:bifunctional UDP-N-acetylglucosamine pyrophosphorylase/glucosamine-1-phosphate N-acetyltransferase